MPLSREKVFKTTTFLAASASTLLALFLLVHVQASFSHSNTSALCLLLSGIALFFTLTTPRFPLCNILSIPLLILSSYKLYTLFTNRAELLFYEPATWGYFLAGFVFAFWSKQIRPAGKSASFLLLSLLIFFLGAFDLITTLIGWNHQTPLDVFYTLGLALTGISLVSANLYWDSSEKSPTAKSLPLIMIGGCFLFTVFLIFGLKAEKQFLLTQSVAMAAQEVKVEIEKDFQQLINSLEKFAGQIDANKGLSEVTWAVNTTALMQDTQELLAIDWLDPAFAVQKSAPEQLIKIPFQISLQLHKDLEKFLPRRASFITAISQTESAPLRLVFFYPNYWDRTFQGFLIYSIDPALFVKHRLLNLLGNRYALELILGDHTLSVSNDTDLQEMQQWKASATATFSNFTVGISLYPSPLFLKEYYNDILLHLSLIGGFLLVFCFALLVYLWQLAKHRTSLEISTAPLSETRCQDFVASSDTWMWEMDTQRILTYSSPSIKKILGFTPQEIVGKDALSLIPKKEHNTFITELNHCIEKKTGWNERQIQWRAKKGSERYLRGHAAPLFDSQGALIGFRGIDTDVTERVLEQESHNEFLAVASHELKTPLTAVHGALGLALAMEGLPEKAQELLKIASRNSERLTSLMTDLLDAKKLPTGQFTLSLQPVSLKAILSEALLSSKPAAEKARVLLVEEGPLPESSVNADPSRLLQVMMNLLSNAIKFSPPEGSVYISTHVLHDKVRVAVRDQGKGIPEQFQDKMFQKFPHPDTVEGILGEGLGLYICKNIIEECLGTMDFTTKKDAGTTFYFELPLLKQE